MVKVQPLRGNKRATFQWSPFSKKQLQIMTWWLQNSPVKDKDEIIADGAVRSGKTLPLSVSFVNWAMHTYDGYDFIMAGKTIGTLRRNVIKNLQNILPSLGYVVEYKRSENLLIINKGEIVNSFYAFGGSDERSQDMVQGFTAAGAFFDEAPLMPRSFVDQATARCSVDGAKYWFTCNPEHPLHWFKKEYIDRSDLRNGIHIRFTMDDNLSLSEKTKNRYKAQYSGIFYRRNILGEWCVAEGLVYSDYRPTLNSAGGHILARQDINKLILENHFIEFIAGVDFGYTSPMAGLLYGVTKDYKFIQVTEFYKTNKLTSDLINWLKEQETIFNMKIKTIFCDSAETDRIEEMRRAGLPARMGKKGKKAMINTVMSLFRHDRIFICEDCKNTNRELLMYSYPNESDPKAARDLPLDENDHAMDAKGYCLHTYCARYGGLSEILNFSNKNGYKIVNYGR